MVSGFILGCELCDLSVFSSRITKQLIEQDGPDWRQKLPEIPLVPLSAQQHHRQKDPSAELVQAREGQRSLPVYWLATSLPVYWLAVP